MEMIKVKVLKHARLNGDIKAPGAEVEIPKNLLEPWERAGFATRIIEKNAPVKPDVTEEPPVAEVEPKVVPKKVIKKVVKK